MDARWNYGGSIGGNCPRRLTHDSTLRLFALQYECLFQYPNFTVDSGSLLDQQVQARTVSPCPVASGPFERVKMQETGYAHSAMIDLISGALPDVKLSALWAILS